MAHVAGLCARTPGTTLGSPSTEELWSALTRGLGAPIAEASAEGVRVAVFAQHAGERADAPRVEGRDAEAHGPSVVVGFGGDAGGAPASALAPPWLACRINSNSRSVTIDTDRHGFALLYLRELPSHVAFSTSACALGRLPPAPPADPSALAELLAFDHLLGERTPRLGITAVPQGYAVSIGPGGVALHRTFRYSDLPLVSSTADAAVRELHLAFDESIAAAVRRHGDGARVLIPLSGGLDSRLIAAAAASTEARDRVEAFTFAHANPSLPPPPDAAIARDVARSLGITWRLFSLEDDWLAEHARLAVELSDGQLDVLHSHGISLLPLFPPGGVRLDGLAGDLVLGGSYLSEKVMRARGTEERLEILWRARARLSQPAWQEVILPEARAELEQRARLSLARSLDQDVEGPSGAKDPRWMDFWALRHRVRRFTVNGPLLWQPCAASIYPFFAPAFLDRVLSVAPELRLRARLQARLFHAGWPRMAGIPWQKTGKPVRRPGLLGSLLDRARRPVFRPGSPFSDADAALRASPRLSSFMEDVLLDARSGVARFGCFDRQAVTRLLTDTRAGVRAGMTQLGLLATLVLAEERWSERA